MGVTELYHPSEVCECAYTCQWKGVQVPERDPTEEKDTLVGTLIVGNEFLGPY